MATWPLKTALVIAVLLATLSPAKGADPNEPAGWITSATRDLTVTQRYLNLPVKNGAPKRRVSLIADGKRVREFEIELADAAPDWWAFLDLASFRGRQVTLRVDQVRADSAGLKSIAQSDQIQGAG